MVVVSSREFRANQKKYFMLANTNDVVIKSREHGAYRLVPVTKDDSVMTKDEFEAKIKAAKDEILAGGGIRINGREELESFLDR